MKKYLKIILSASIFFLLYSFCNADEVTIGTIERPPFAYQENGQWTGFSIDLWKEIASRHNLEYSFQEYSVFGDMLAATGSGKVDLSVANITISYSREKIMDFSQPIFDSGLNILAREGQSGIKSFLSFFTNDLPKMLLYLVLGIIGLAHFFWVRSVIRGNAAFYKYFTDIFLVFFEVVRQIKDAYALRILFVTILGVSVFFVSYYSQRVAVVFASQDEAIAQSYISEYINIEISELSDLRVGVTRSSSSEKYMTRKKVGTIGYDDFEKMISDLGTGELDVIVHDDPLLRYFTENEGKGEFVVVRKTFQAEKFGIAFTEGSDLRETVDRTILELHESGKYDEIYERYFGED